MASMDNMSTVTVLRSSAAERNKQAILEVLKGLIPDSPILALEIASGTGQHISHLAEHLPSVTWQPSECDEKSIQSIMGYIQVTERSNIHSPVWIDVTRSSSEWAEGKLSEACCDLILCVNMVHIAPWAAAQGLFSGCGYYLKPGGTLALYGPFKIHGEITPESNIQFDQMLKQQNVDWGLRDVDDLQKLAEENGMNLDKVVEMPANNKTLVFRKAS